MNRGPTAKNPLVIDRSHNEGVVDFSGQDGYEQVATEQLGDAPELAGVLVRKYIPEMSGSKVTVYQSDDLRLHDASSGPGASKE